MVYKQADPFIISLRRCFFVFFHFFSFCFVIMQHYVNPFWGSLLYFFFLCFFVCVCFLLFRLSVEYDISVNESKLLLSHFVSSHTDLCIIYLLSGCLKTDNVDGLDGRHEIMLVSEEELETAKKRFSYILSQHIFSIQPKSLTSVPTISNHKNTDDNDVVMNDIKQQDVKEIYHSCILEVDNSILPSLTDNRYSAIANLDVKRRTRGAIIRPPSPKPKQRTAFFTSSSNNNTASTPASAHNQSTSTNNKPHVDTGAAATKTSVSSPNTTSPSNNDAAASPNSAPIVATGSGSKPKAGSLSSMFAKQVAKSNTTGTTTSSAGSSTVTSAPKSNNITSMFARSQSIVKTVKQEPVSEVANTQDDNNMMDDISDDLSAAIDVQVKKEADVTAAPTITTTASSNSKKSKSSKKKKTKKRKVDKSDDNDDMAISESEADSDADSDVEIKKKKRKSKSSLLSDSDSEPENEQEQYLGPSVEQVRIISAMFCPSVAIVLHPEQYTLIEALFVFVAVFFAFFVCLVSERG